MTNLGTFVGFAMVFVLTAWTLSAVIALMLPMIGSLRRWFGPAAERRSVALATALPLLVASIVVATLIARSVAGTDHCAAHDHHAHLCLAHGHAWAERPWAVALVAAAVAITLARLALLGGALLRGRRAIAQLRAASTSLDDVRLVDSPQPFCFVAGLRRAEIYASTGAWHGLASDERDAMLAHERGHVRHHDLAWRTLLEVVGAFGAPLTPRPLLARWEHATERLRDEEAGDVASPEAVAGAMVHMCRLGAGPLPSGLVGFAAPPAALDDRVRALLAGGPRGYRAATTLGAGGLVVMVLVGSAIAAHAEPLHHALESLLG